MGSSIFLTLNRISSVTKFYFGFISICLFAKILDQVVEENERGFQILSFSFNNIEKQWVTVHCESRYIEPSPMNVLLYIVFEPGYFYLLVAFPTIASTSHTIQRWLQFFVVLNSIRSRG